LRERFESLAAVSLILFEDHRMTSGFYRKLTALTIAAASLMASQTADARYRYYDRDPDDDRYSDPLLSRTPLLAVVALREQRVSVYDAKGKFLEAPVSTGQNGLETPAGIFSIVQKEEEHHSSLYDDASMPFMERITWTGVALHAGVLPGYPASHGCIRMPESFAEKLYGLTSLGMRVIIVREDIAPADVSQPAMFTPDAASSERDAAGRVRTAIRMTFTDVENAKRHEKEARAAAVKRNEETKAASRAEQNAQAALEKAQADLKAAEQAAATAPEDKAASAQAAKAQAQAKIENAEAQLKTAQAEAAAKAEAARQAAEEARAAAIALAKAADAYEAAELDVYPVSVFISRKTQRLYVRKNNMPIYESQVTIRDAEKPIGTFVYTATEGTDNPGIMRWKMVSMYKDPSYVSAEPELSPVSNRNRSKAVSEGGAPANVAGAEAALSRIDVPEEAKARISATVLPGSSLIISDEPQHLETGKDTDFIVIMSGEPQGTMTVRHHPKKDRGVDFLSDAWFGGGRSARSGRGGFSLFGD
jgi:hypothetical protein